MPLRIRRVEPPTGQINELRLQGGSIDPGTNCKYESKSNRRYLKHVVGFSMLRRVRWKTTIAATPAENHQKEALVERFRRREGRCHYRWTDMILQANWIDRGGLSRHPTGLNIYIGSVAGHTP